VEEGQVEGLEGVGGAAGADAVHDILFDGGGDGGWVGDVGEAHFVVCFCGRWKGGWGWWVGEWLVGEG